MQLCSETMFRHLMAAPSHGVWCFLAADDLERIRAVCRVWRRWVDESRLLRPPAPLRTLTTPERTTVLEALTGLGMPWSDLTDKYIQGVLSTTPSVHTADDIPELIRLLQHLYQRAVLAPATNIGTLDTTRVIERLTQARLSRFHSTGAASIQQASNLENLLHPQQSTKRAQMLIHLDAHRVDIHSAQAVLNHIRGKILHTTLNAFVVPRVAPFIFIQSVDAVPPLIAGPEPITGFCIQMDPDAMTWHNHTIVDIVTTLRLKHQTGGLGFSFIPMHTDGKWLIYVIVDHLSSLPIVSGDDKWRQPLPSLETMVSGVVWPSIADIFCADSSSVHTHFRLPVMTKRNAQDIIEWGTKLQEDAQEEDDNETPSTPTNSVPGTTVFSESGRKQEGLRVCAWTQAQSFLGPCSGKPVANGERGRWVPASRSSTGVGFAGGPCWSTPKRPRTHRMPWASHPHSCSSCCSG